MRRRLLRRLERLAAVVVASVVCSEADNAHQYHKAELLLNLSTRMLAKEDLVPVRCL